jgi:hypothetical protein
MTSHSALVLLSYWSIVSAAYGNIDDNLKLNWRTSCVPWHAGRARTDTNAGASLRTFEDVVANPVLYGAMPLNLYRRRQGGCEAGHPVECRDCEFDERKKGWKRCGCFIFASGTLGTAYRRKYTGRITWEDARAVAAVACPRSAKAHWNNPPAFFADGYDTP